MASLVLKLGGRDLQQIPITATQTLIGRDPRCDVFIDNPAISRRHARIEFRNGQFMVFDTTSRNGVYINNEPVTSAPLQDRTVMQIGKFTLIFFDAGGVSHDKLRRFEPKETDAPVFNEGTTMLDRAYLERLRGSTQPADTVTETQVPVAAAQAVKPIAAPPGTRTVTALVGLVIVLLLALIYAFATR